MPRRRSAGVTRILGSARLVRKSPRGTAGGYGGGPVYLDAFRARRAPTATELAESFKGICYACATLNAGGVVRTPLRLYAATRTGQARPKCATRRLTKSYADRERVRWLAKAEGYAQYMHAADEVDEVMDHPLLDLLRVPNPDFDHHGLIRHASLSLDMFGSCYWEPERDGQPADGAMPNELWPLLAQYVIPVRLAGQSQIERYTYFGQNYEPRSLMRARFVGLRDPYGFGYGPAEAAYEYVTLRDQFVSVQENLLGQGMRPSAVISLKDGAMPMGRDERRRFEQDINSKWRGSAAGRVFVADGALDVKPLMFPPSDLAALQISDNALQQIANCFGIPISLLKTEDVNLANAEAGHRQHAELAIQPRCVLIASAFTRWIHGQAESLRKAFGRDPGWDRLFVAFDNPVAEDRQKDEQLWDMRLTNGSATINERRNASGEDNVPWGDEPWLSNSLVQPSAAAEQRDREEERAGAERPVDSADPEEIDDSEGEGESEGEDESTAGKSLKAEWQESDHRRDDQGQFSSTGGDSGKPKPKPKPAPVPTSSPLTPPTEIGAPLINPAKVSDQPIKLSKTSLIAWSKRGDWEKNVKLAGQAAVVRGVPKTSINTDDENYRLFDEVTGNMFMTMMIPAAYEANRDIIYFNQAAFFWGHPDESDRRAADQGEAASGNAEHAVDHEVGHYFHRHKIGLAAYLGLHHKALPPADKALAKRHVGRYAASSVNDFVAEVYAGRKAGKTYPARINTVYRMYGGPEDP